MSKEVDLTAISYGAFAVMALFALLLLSFEMAKRKTLSLLQRGYYFVEIHTGKNTRLIPVPPDNVDASDPLYPRIINPALVDANECFCCT